MTGRMSNTAVPVSTRARAKFVGVKNMMNFRNGYRKIRQSATSSSICPGRRLPDMRMLPFRRVPRPVYPLDVSTAEPVARMYSNAVAQRGLIHDNRRRAPPSLGYRGAAL